MGLGMSCGVVGRVFESDSTQSALHIAAAKGQIKILCLLLDRSVNPDVLNRRKQTPLMLAAMHGKFSCVKKLLEAGAGILMFDSINERTCLHYAAYYGHSDCLQAILSAAKSSHVASSREYARFVNIKDRRRITPLHLASLQGRPGCVQILLENGARVGASTETDGYIGSRPLHFAARGGCLDCIRKLVAWGADCLDEDNARRTPYYVALYHKHRACAELLKPSSSAEPLNWPTRLKFINELDDETEELLEDALREVNQQRRENSILKATHSLPPPSDSDSDSDSYSYSDSGLDDNTSEVTETEVCCICFEQTCTIKVEECGHQMCAQCTISFCCYNNPNWWTTASLPPPVCPFCRSTIGRLVAIDHYADNENNSSSKSVGSFGQMGVGHNSDQVESDRTFISFRLG